MTPDLAARTEEQAVVSLAERLRRTATELRKEVAHEEMTIRGKAWCRVHAEDLDNAAKGCDACVEQDRLIGELVRALDDHGVHGEACPMTRGGPCEWAPKGAVCVCGLDDVLARPEIAAHQKEQR